MISAAPEGDGFVMGAGICGGARVLEDDEDVKRGSVACGAPLMSSVR